MTLEVPAGEFTVVLGPSGCGKSTLLRTVNRLVVPQSGTVYIDDANTADADPVSLRRRIGYVIQAVGLFAHMTIAQNIAVIPSLLRWDRARIDARVSELLELVGLDPARYKHRRPRELSGGEQQRVGVARALAGEPPVMLMDEPFGAVDAIVRGTLQDEITRIAARLKTTIFFVTHDVDEALRLADRIVVMRDGKVEQHDTPLGILTAPATPYVEQLLDTHDAVRRLSLLHAADAAEQRNEPADGRIDGDATLRDALNEFLTGARVLAVERSGVRLGVLSFDDVRKALREPM